MRHRASFLTAGLAALLWGMTALAGAADPLQSPVRLDWFGQGMLLVSDYATQSICSLNRKTLDVRTLFSVQGHPLAVGASKGKIFVGNETTGAVEVYDPSGNWLYDLGGAKGLFILPNDLVVDTDRDLVLVVDSGAREVKVFSVDGTFLYPLTAAQALESPTAIALDRQRQEIYISDFGPFANSVFRRPQPKVRVFDYGGNELRTLRGSFVRPQGLATDGAGHLFVVDSLEGQIQVLAASDGALLQVIGSFGTAPGQLQLPLDVIQEPKSGDLYVTSNQNGRIEVFRKGEILP